MASCSHKTYRASSDAPECNEQVSDELKMSKSLEEDARDVISDDPEEQLLQAIRRGATAGEVESYLDLSFKKLQDYPDGFFFPLHIHDDHTIASLAERRAQARARVYDKALGEAKDGTPIEEFLVNKLRTDECLRKAGHCAIVYCAAVRWRMTNIVLALIQWRGAAGDGTFLQKEELLAIAVEYRHVELVRHLTKMEDVNVNIKFNRNWHVYKCLEVYLESNTARLNDFVFLKPIASAARMGNVQMVMSLLACDRIDLNEGEPLHWAAAMGHPDVVEQLLKSTKQVDVNAVKNIPMLDIGVRNESRYGLGFSPLQLASLFGHTSVVQALCEDTKGRFKPNTENWSGITALQIATEKGDDETVKILLERPEVAKQMKNLYRDRHLHVDAANAILVGAALIASVTFVGWLTPPLGYSAFFGSASIEVGAPSPSGIYPSFVSVAGHPIMQIFWFFNSMSFFFAIATLMVGASAALPPQRLIFIWELVQSSRDTLSLAYLLFTISVGCGMGAFASAGFLVLPPIPKYMVNMGFTVGIGVTVVFLAYGSSNLLFTLEVMKKIVKKPIFQILKSKIMMKILSDKIRMKLLDFFL
jgi:hypothetical protein